MKTRTKVIIINGTPTAGKDTFINFAAKYCNAEESTNIFNISSVDLIKEMLVGFGWNGEKTDDIREIISKIKQIWINAQNGATMFLINNIINIHAQHQAEDNIIFCHVREPEEIDKLYQAFKGFDIVGIDVMTLFIVRKGIDIASTNDADNIDVIFNYHYDTVIKNDGDLAQLEEKAIDFIDGLLED
jgi:hypothetical protein